jgi:hypothetical protein
MSLMTWLMVPVDNFLANTASSWSRVVLSGFVGVSGGSSSNSSVGMK